MGLCRQNDGARVDRTNSTLRQGISRLVLLSGQALANYRQIPWDPGAQMGDKPRTMACRPRSNSAHRGASVGWLGSDLPGPFCLDTFVQPKFDWERRAKFRSKFDSPNKDKI